MGQLNQTKRKIFSLLAAAFAAVCTLSVFPSCTPAEERPVWKNNLSFLKTDGDRVVDADGNSVILRGVNAGGLFVIEQWMNGFAKSSSDKSDIVCKDHKTVSKVFAERFGREKAQELWRVYSSNWWSAADFQNCADMGMNVIRLPFTYMNVDFGATFDYAEAGRYDFSCLDEFVETAADYGLYTILDLHGAYGSQNGQDHSGESLPYTEVDFYSNEDMQGLTVDLWRALAKHFKDNNAVAGYDILNEPAEKINADNDTCSTEERHFAVFDRIYDAIREEDEEHIVIFESCWEGYNLPQPSQYGWENCMYSFHHYSKCSDGQSYEKHCKSFDDKLANVAAQQFGVPLYMGEFTAYDSEEQWDYTLKLLNDNGWHWTSWTYKIDSSWGNSAWGIFCLTADAESKVNAHTDSYDAIVEKFRGLATTAQSPRSTFRSGRTLFELIAEYCKQ